MIKKLIENYGDGILTTADGFDEAILGVDESTLKVIYSVSKCIEILMKDMTEEQAIEYFYHNVSGSLIGEKTPIWCNDDF